MLRRLDILILVGTAVLCCCFGCTESASSPSPIPCDVCPPETTSHDFAWAIDTLAPTPNLVSRLWGTDPANIYAIGWFDTAPGYELAHWNGSVWTVVPVQAFRGPDGIHGGSLLSIFGTSSNSVWVVGQGRDSNPFTKEILLWPYVARWDGHSWTTVSPHLPGRFLFGGWARSPSDVWVSGDQGTLLHFDGAGWTASPSGTSHLLFDVWGGSGQSTIVVGGASDNGSGIVLVFDGAAWTPVPQLRDLGPVTSVWISPQKTAWIASHSGIYRCLDSLWHFTAGLTFGTPYSRIRGAHDSDVFTCGPAGRLAHFNGSSWREYHGIIPNQLGVEFTDVLVLGDHVFVSGLSGAVLRGTRR